MTVEELLRKSFEKIGLLVLEMDELRDQLNEARREIERLTPTPDNSDAKTADKQKE